MERKSAIKENGVSSGMRIYRRLLRTGCRLRCSVAVMLLLTVPIVWSCADLSRLERHTPRNGRERVLEALIPQEGGGGLLGSSGVISTALSSSDLAEGKLLKSLDPADTPDGLPFSRTLKDGTVVEGLFFEYQCGDSQPKPIVMASFGFLQDRWGSEAAKFHNLYLKEPEQRIPAHVLILDHPSSGPFLANNGHLSMGAYDDARMWIEIASQLRDEMSPAGIHLFGVSMSGQTVVHALIEDKRRNLDLFASGIAVSIAPDFQKAPGKQLAQCNVGSGVENPWRAYFGGAPEQTAVDALQNEALWMLIKDQFIPHYHYVNPTDLEFKLHKKDVAVFLRTAFEDRINFLNAADDITWNRDDYSLENLDAFMSTTRIAGIIDRVRTPLVLVSALDDPAVEDTMFKAVLKAVQGNRWIAAREVSNGGHFGFDVAYGKEYLGRLIRLMMDNKILTTWNRNAE